jgi:hypothetical protein
MQSYCILVAMMDASRFIPRRNSALKPAPAGL